MKVGVLLLENTHLTGPGSMAHAASYGGDAVFRTMSGVMGRQLVDRPDLVRVAVVAAARDAAAAGAEAITMNCGFGVLFQRDVAEATKAATVSSGLILLPLLAAIHGGKVGVLTYDRAALSPAHLAAAGWPEGKLPPAADVQRFAEWRRLEEEGTITLDLETMGRQLMELACDFATGHGLAALLLECSGMLPFKARLKAATGCAVYDVFDALEFVRRARIAS